MTIKRSDYIFQGLSQISKMLFSIISGNLMKITFPIYKRQNKSLKKWKLRLIIIINQIVVFIVSSTQADL